MDPTVADLDGRVLLVWAESGRTHMRLAPLGELANADDIDDLPSMEGPILSRHLWVRRGVAIVAERTTAGIGAMRVDENGVQTLRVEDVRR